MNCEIIFNPHQVELRNPRRQPADAPLVEEEEKEIVVDAAIERKRPMTKEEMNLKKKTRKRTRKFEIDGVTVTTTTSKVIYRDEERGEKSIFDEMLYRVRARVAITAAGTEGLVLNQVFFFFTKSHRPPRPRSQVGSDC